MRLFLVILILFLTGCAQKDAKPILIFEQSVSKLQETPKIDDYDLYVFYQEFLRNHFSVWKQTNLKESKDFATWGYRLFTKDKDYVGENLVKIEDSWYEHINNISIMSNYGQLLKKGITTKNTHLRVFPTQKPIYKKSNVIGMGYPFDLLQNSFIPIMTPVFISHFTKDSSWAFVETSYASGWIKINDLSLIDNEVIEILPKMNYIITTKEQTPVYKDGNFITHLKLGTILPLKNEDEFYYYVYLIDENSSAYEASVEKKYMTYFPVLFSDIMVKKILNELIGEKYGWGGLYENRDCSAMTKDFFSIFGIWLPRNSFAQKNEGVMVDISKYSNTEKERVIKQYAIPYLSLIYLPGHIMLYVGEIDGKIAVFHNIWGVKTLEKGISGRHILGKTVITDLHIGENEKHTIKNNLLIDRVTSFNIIASKESVIGIKLKRSYPDFISHIKDNFVYFKDNSTIIFDDKKEKTFDEILENPDIKDMFSQKYIKGKQENYPTQDPGRIRNDTFFGKIYGNTKDEIEKNLTEVVWLPKKLGIKLLFNEKNGAAKALQQVSNELDNLPDEYLEYLTEPAGTYNFRKIAKTDRLSAHSYGIAIDINTKKSNYWLWDSGEYVYRNLIPQEIVDIFEKNGFIWGGKWYHYDTMHFEFRPELL